ncbi:MAG: D-alanyl-D-alanine carboxypeptidase [Austwickia sp.]|nr:D-alanyl-D-alanine carboxypeptidase [Austwickia sp.]
MAGNRFQGSHRPVGRRHGTVGSVALAVALLAAPLTALPAAAAPAPAAAAAAPMLAPAEDRDRLRDSGVVVDVPTDVPAPPELAAAAYVLADLGSGDVLLARGAHEAHLSASTMKLLTAQTLMPRLAGDTKIRATDSDASVDGTRVGMVPGREYTADQLFHALLMGSANDAGEALARANGGLENTLTQMSERAAQLGAKDTVPKTPHGLDADGQQTTAYDLVAILRGALDTPAVAQILTTQTYPFPKYVPVETPPAGSSDQDTSSAPSLAGTQQVASQNKLLWNYEGAIGGKDGYTDAAGHTYVGAVRKGDKTYAVSFMGATSNDWKAMAALLDWAFANGTKAKAVGKLPGAVAPVGAPAAGPAADAKAATSVDATEGGGVLAAIGAFLLAVLRVLGWTILVLGVAAVALRVRKLRRDAARREARRRRLEADLVAGLDAAARRPQRPAMPPQRPATQAGSTRREVPVVATAYGSGAYDAAAYDSAYDMAADGTVPYQLPQGEPDGSWSVRPVGGRTAQADSFAGPVAGPAAGPVRTKERIGRQ